ncbi:hypothetical protein BJ138DRAFT_1010424 [Hygrophoropsis aurantiaca]|uniref:Uncharacterized protein n=1 Tax=Hygrophoropsis aurantiaca TaxID=72124 RepID=A0ACB8A843_9AGAM|nr:hypothetical protein BJ138DRAFT_1010424 [Hygrophoropsis aurantiaca]
MPQRYRRDSITHQQPSASDALEPSDADDSIVLSDLVRTGEASRLRRRGAMRLDHNLLNAQRNESERVSPPAPIIIRAPSWIDPPSDDESSQTWEQNYEPPLSPRSAPNVTVGESYNHILFCGGDERAPRVINRKSEIGLSPLPSYPPSSESRHSINRSPSSSRYTNGCGAVIHMRASPRGRSNIWQAKTEATSAVIPLDASYFERSAVVKTVRSTCGCIREGVGCAICGNALGSRYKPCQAAAEGLFTPHRHVLHPMRPEGPAYWHARPSTAVQDNQPFIYTFFASNVSSSSPLISPPNETDVAPVQQDFLSPVDNPFEYNIFDRAITASPSALSDREERTSPYLAQTEPDFDPDGTVIADEPGSPDKVITELPLFPGR